MTQQTFQIRLGENTMSKAITPGIWSYFLRKCQNVNAFDLIPVFFFGAILTAVHFFQHNLDRNWDRASTHDYVFYSFMNATMTNDWLAASQGTWTNPLSELPIYSFEAILGAKYGGLVLTLLIMILISIEILVIINMLFSNELNRFLRIITIVLSLLSPFWLAEVGTTFQNWVSVPVVLLGVIFLVKHQPNLQTAKRNLLLSGIFFGFAAGFKLTNALYALALILSIFVFAILKRDAQVLKLLLRTSGGIAIGISIFVPWMAWVWREMENPIFPNFNKFFQSQYYPNEDFRDSRWMFDSFGDLLSVVSGWSYGSNTAELRAFDPRLPIIFLLSIGLSLFVASKVFSKKGEKVNSFNEQQTRFLIWSLLSVLIWVRVFFYSRYLEPVEMLYGVIILLLLTRISLDRIKQQLVLPFIVLVSFNLMVVPNWTTASSTPGMGNSDNRWDSPLSEKAREIDGVLLVMGEPVSFIRLVSPKVSNMIRIDAFSLPPKYLKIAATALENGEHLYVIAGGGTIDEGVIQDNIKRVNPSNLVVRLECQELIGPITVKYNLCTVMRAPST